ncbi:WXG100 family type VII secretion target [Streptomyces coffeae]|uniref:Uncharacterized protein n=1 Tax=Streptomyces coffeae TaxID=621382 RepID=A0ABS1NR47_9ACTN|nr:hypothetical protein [Streptomyces coffeae]MBL1102352.1 hypothetical protein [Streptomyces coffeae]
MAPGKFDHLKLPVLLAMLAGADPAKLVNVGAALSKAATPLHDLADELVAHTKRPQWEGEGADAFRGYSEKLVKQTRVMADYTFQVGLQMWFAGQGLYGAYSGMPRREECSPDDWKPKLSKEDEEKRQQALQMMDLVDSFYEVSHGILKDLKEPNFPQLPREDSFADYGKDQTSYGGGGNTYAAAAGGGGATASPKSFAVAPHATDGGSDASDGGSATPISHPGVGTDGGVGSGVGATAPPATGTNIDSTAPPIDPVDRPTLPTAPPVGPEQRTTGPGPGPFPVPGPVVPGTTRVIPPGTSRMPNVPPTLRGGPPPGPVGRPIGTPPGPTTGRPLIPPRTGPQDGITSLSRPPRGPVPRLPQTTVVGEERPLMGRNLMGGGYHPPHTNPTTPGPNGSGRRLASERGGMVDRPNGKGPANGQRLPRTTVVGEERGIPVRGPMGTGSHPITGGPDGPGGTGARRVSSEPGGVTGSPRATGKGRSEFTPGGAGLVRNAQTPGMIPPRSEATRPGDRQDQNGTTPDYLQEDDETWTGGRRDTVPPVID